MLQAASPEEDQTSRHLFAAFPRQAVAEEAEFKNLPLQYVFNNDKGNQWKKVRRSPEEATFERLTKSLAKNQDGIHFQRLTKRSKPNDEEIFERLTKRGNADEDEGGFMRITKKNDYDEISQYILFSYLPFQKMKYAGLWPLTNVGLI